MLRHCASFASALLLIACSPATLNHVPAAGQYPVEGPSGSQPPSLPTGQSFDGTVLVRGTPAAGMTVDALLPAAGFRSAGTSRTGQAGRFQLTLTESLSARTPIVFTVADGELELYKLTTVGDFRTASEDRQQIVISTGSSLAAKYLVPLLVALAKNGSPDAVQSTIRAADELARRLDTALAGTIRDQRLLGAWQQFAAKPTTAALQTLAEMTVEHGAEQAAILDTVRSIMQRGGESASTALPPWRFAGQTILPLGKVGMGEELTNLVIRANGHMHNRSWTPSGSNGGGVSPEGPQPIFSGRVN